MPLLSVPLLLGHKGKAVADLHNLIFWFINNGHLKISEGQDLEYLSRLSKEQTAELYGDATAYFVERVYGLVGGWEGEKNQINENAAIAIEEFFSGKENPNIHKVYGRVVNENGVGIPEVIIVALLKTLREETEVESTQSDNRGYYEMEIDSVSDPSGNNFKTALQLRASSSTGLTVESPLIFNVGKTTNVDLVLPVANDGAMETEFQVIEAKVREAVGESELSTLTHRDLDFLKSINENEFLLLTYLYAVEYARITGHSMEAEAFYGLLRTNGITSYQAIFNWSREHIESLLLRAIAANYISSRNPDEIADTAGRIKEVAVSLITESIGQAPSEAPTIRILKMALTKEQVTAFLRYYNAGDTLDDVFWKEERLSEAIGTSPDTIRKLKKTLIHAVNTGNNPLLVRHIMGSKLQDIVAQSEEEWENLLKELDTQEEFIIPEAITGESQEERLENYARYLHDTYSNSYKTEYAQAKITDTASAAFPTLKDSLQRFVSANPDFDILRTPVAKLSDGTYDLSSYPAQAFIEEVGKVQRLNALTNNFDAVEKLAAADIYSAMDITRMTQAEFREAFSEDLGGDTKVFEVYDKALSTAMTSQLFALEPYLVNQLDFQVIYDTTSPTSIAAQLEWRSLFGSVDYCTCEHCLSVFSPAAYFVDCMELLRRFDAPAAPQTTAAYNWLKLKRDDLWHLKLTCKNTNTSIPAIDIVNETLEMVIGGAPLAEPSLANLNAAKNTTSDARLNRAIPEHINSAGPDTPYHKLLEAQYPWSAPYNYYADQCRTYLGLIDLKPYQIGQAFSKADYPKTLDTIELACSYLGISTSSDPTKNSELAILKDADPGKLHKYYGLLKIDGIHLKPYIVDPADRMRTIPVPSRPADLQNGFLEKVNVFLQQAQLSLKDLLELLDCYYVNPVVWDNGSSYRQLRIKGDPETTCDTDKLRIVIAQTGGTVTGYRFVDFLYNSMRIVRLSRKTGLSMYEVDQILTAYGLNYDDPITDTVLIFMAQALRTKELLNVSLEEILPFWADFPHSSYNDYSGDRPQQIPTFYERLFRNQSIVPDFEKIPYYPFKELSLYDQWIGAPASVGYEQMRSWVLAILKLTTKDLEYLIRNFYGDALLFDSNTTNFIIGRSEFNFSHSNILHLYREVTLARLLHLPVEKWVAYRKWVFRHQTYKEPFSNLVIGNPPGSGISGNPALLIGFLEKIRVFEQQALPFEVMQYAFWDALNELQEKEIKRKLLIGQLSGLRDILSKFQLDYQDISGNTYVINSTKLQRLLLLLVTPLDADFLINDIALKERPSLASFSPDDIHRFESLLPQALSPADKILLFGDPTASPQIAPNTDRQERLQVLVNIFLPALKEKANRKEPVSYLSAQNGISTEMAELLLSDYIEVGGEKGLKVLLSELFIKSTQPITVATLSTPEFQKPFNVIEKLHKVSLVINSLSLSVDELTALKKYYNRLYNTAALDFLSNPKVGNLLNDTPDPWPDDLDATYNFIGWMQVRNAFVPSPLGLHYVLSEVSKASSADRKEVWVLAMSKSLQMPVSEIEVLVGKSADDGDLGALNFNFGAGLPQPFQYRKLFAALDMMKWLEAGASTSVEIAEAVLRPYTQADADKIIQVVKSRYGSTEWLDIVQPVSDVLRVNRRDAMVAFLLAFPPVGYAGRWISELDIFETLLIDTQVMPVVQTSRIRQAISSLQLFIDRCILQREVTLPTSNPANEVVVLGGEVIRQWNLWRKWYRVWEANRKVFVYPENWIEPELRDDKSPFFKDLEKFINQNDITPETMEDAYKTYLERLDEVAFLDIIGYYVEDIKTATGELLDSVVHTFGRTRSYPHLYYYRKRVNRTWNAWEKMDTQIDGDHFVPVMWRGRLRLYWVTFMEKIIPTQKKLRLDEEQEAPRLKHDLILHWTEYKNGKWAPSQVGNQNAVMNFGGEASGPSTGEDLKYHIARPIAVNSDDWANIGLAHTQKSYEMELARMKERMLVYATKGSEGELRIECATYMVGLTYTQFRRFIFDKYSKNMGGTDSDVDVWFGDQYKNPPVIIGKFADSNYATDGIIAYALTENSDWLIDRLNGYYDYENKLPLAKVGRRYGFVIKHHKVEIQEWGYSQYNEFIDDPNARFGQKNNLYIYPRQKQESDGYDQMMGYISATRNSPSIISWLKLLNKAPDFAFAPVKEKYLILQKQYPDAPYTPVKIGNFFYQDYKNLFFIEKYTQESFEEMPATFSNSLNEWTKGLKVGKKEIANSTKSISTERRDDSRYDSLFITRAIPPSYRFYSFYHYRVNDLLEQLSIAGVKGLFNWAFTLQGQRDRMDFRNVYAPTGAVVRNDGARDLYPTDTLDFWIDAPTAIYNWELFFHIPMLIANKLMQEQRFMDAMDWYHLVFNPTNQEDASHGGNTSARFWQFYPFFQHAQGGVPSIHQIMANPDLPIAVRQWARDPFKPHLVARNRIGAYMRNVVMKYLDNLVAWGDNLFRRDTMESINEATLLYVLAAQMLGKRPVKIPARLSTAPMDYEDLLTTNRWNAFSNALVPIQTYLATTTAPVPGDGEAQMYYFCIPPNEKLLSYWDVVADRLYKIRNSQSIDGVERQLTLFEPPIDPAMLVRAAAAGISIADAVAELYAPLPAYRFPTMVQKATELAQEVKSLGSALLAAIEKRDAEQLALLRSVQEQKVLQAAKEARTLQIQEAQAQVAGLNEQKDLINERIGHYQRLVEKRLNQEEESQLESLQKSIPLKQSQGDLSALSSVFYAIPEVNLQFWAAVGTSFGGSNIGNLINAKATTIGTDATVNDIKGSMAGIKAGYVRRREEWDMQLKLAAREIRQIEKQIVAAEIRQAIAEKELRVQEIQIQNARDLDAAMHDKYSNEDLYNWMISEISYTYFQSYKLAFDIARKAERCYRYELGVEPIKDFIQFGYWNSLKKGLLAADNLLFDVKRLEMSYLEQNVRYHELSKSISLAAIDPVALLNLRASSGANIALPEWIFDMDYPGHYFRRIKSVSISIPCVAGPYTTVAAKLTLISSKYRKNALPGSGTTGYKEGESDPRFNYLFNGGQSIATSTAQNDSGMFELNFRDERYLPFEGCGAISNWKLDLPGDFANYDRNTITDVIIHVNYTARYDGGLATGAKAYLNDLMRDNNITGTDPKGIPPYQLLSLKHEFSTEWYAAFQSLQAVPGISPANNAGRKLSIILRKTHFPIGVQGKDLTITNVSVVSRKDAKWGYGFNANAATSEITVLLPYTGTGTSPTLSAFSGTIKDNQPKAINITLYKSDGMPLAESDLDDLYLLIEYKVEIPSTP